MAKNLLILCTEYKAMKAREDELKREMESVKAEILDIMGGQEKVTCGQYTATNQTIISHVIDTKRLKAERPDIATEYTEEKTTSRFTVK